MVLFLSILCLYLIVRNFNQSSELTKALNLVEQKSEQLSMLQGLILEAEPSRSMIKGYLEKSYPNDSLGPYSSQIVWRDIDLYFDASTKNLDAIGSNSDYWTCGTLFGCTSENSYYLPEMLRNPFIEYVARFTVKFSYPFIFITYITLLIILYRSRNNSLNRVKYILAFLMLLVGVIVSQITGYAWWEAIYGSHVSINFLIAGWREVGYKFFISILLAISILGVSNLLEAWLKKSLRDSKTTYGNF